MLTNPLSFQLNNEDATIALATKFAAILAPKDVLLLEGPIGAGKSFFSRALIRARTKTTEDIPSPTFTIVQTYPHENGDIWHCDLYRIGSSDDVIELGLDDAFDTAICLIEWPDRLGNLTPENALYLNFSVDGAIHTITVSENRNWAERLLPLHD